MLFAINTNYDAAKAVITDFAVRLCYLQLNTNAYAAKAVITTYHYAFMQCNLQ